MSSSYKGRYYVPTFGVTHEALLSDDMCFSSLYLVPNYLYKYEPSGRHYRLIEIVDQQTLLMQSVDTKEIKMMAGKYFTNINAFLDSRGFDSSEYIGDDIWLGMQNKYHAVAVVAYSFRNGPLEIAVDASVLKEWVDKFSRNNVRANLLDRDRVWSNSPTEIDFRNYHAIRESVEYCYLNIRRLSVEATIRYAQNLCHDKKYNPPTEAIMRKIITQLPDKLVVNARKVKGEAPVIPYPLGIIPSMAQAPDRTLDYYEEIV